MTTLNTKETMRRHLINVLLSTFWSPGPSIAPTQVINIFLPPSPSPLAQ